MRLSELSVDEVRKALQIYLDLAYGGSGKHRRMPDLSRAEAGGDLQALLAMFQKERVEDIPGYSCVRYTLRLGNRNYPFMKLMLQEHLLAGEFFFAVDTHDDMDIKPDFPDYEEWMAVRRFNQELKRKIETQFEAEGLDTSAAIRRLVGSRGGSGGPGKKECILIVDDEEDLAETVESLLREKGYTTYKVFDGKAAIRAVAEIHPDLVLLDYELPEMDGLEVIARLRADASTRDTPVLLASAGRISLQHIRKADGFLAKPFQEGLLYEMVQRVLKQSKEARP